MNDYPIDEAYAERVYAGVLGKIIGVYLGRPFEGWAHERILAELGEVDHYVHEQLGVPLVVADDDISGTFTFLRALEDHGFDPDISPAQIGDTWLNYIVEQRAILWWGGIGTSTEHTAYLRLKRGIAAPQSGSIALNGLTVAEQIGAQIFIDGWGLVCPGDPEAAIDFARRSASVSHDGEAIYGAQAVAAMVAAAFDAPSMDAVISAGLAAVPPHSVISQLYRAVVQWKDDGHSWKGAFQQLKAAFGYDRYGGGCHVVPNHGIVVLALAYGKGDFSRSLMIANTCGWDTDCNSANVGCILGVYGGLAGINGGHFDWRSPVRDRILLPTADGGRCVTDAVAESLAVARTAAKLRGVHLSPPKGGAKFSFCFPGSVQGFGAIGATLTNVDSMLLATLDAREARVMTPTFPTASERKSDGYTMVMSPTLYPGQRVSAVVRGERGTPRVALCFGTLTGNDQSLQLRIDAETACDGQWATIEATVPDTCGYPLTEVGLVIYGQPGDAISIDSLTWSGAPNTTFQLTPAGSAWREAWMNGVDDFALWGDPFRLIQNEGTGLLSIGTRQWTDICIESEVDVHLVERAGVAVRVQGMRRYYALLVTRDGRVQLVKCVGGSTVLAETAFDWSFGERLEFQLMARGSSITGTLNGRCVLTADDSDLDCGGVGFVLTEGRIGARAMTVSGA